MAEGSSNGVVNASAAVSIGNYKGVMLCNRPFSGVSSTLAKESRSNNDAIGSSSFKAVFLAGNPGEPIGMNVPTLSEPGHAMKRDKNTALSKHKKWLHDLQKERARLQDALAADDADKQKQKDRFSQCEAKFREAVRVNNCDSDDKKSSKMRKPMWALTKESADEKLGCMEDQEADNLIDFANNLDIDQFMDDVEIKARMAQVEQQLAQMQSIVEYEEAEEKRSEREQQRLDDKAVALNANDLARLDRAGCGGRYDDDDDMQSVASSVLSECKSIRSAHSMCSMTALTKRMESKLRLEQQQGDAVVNLRVVTIGEEQGARMQIKTLASNLPYIHRNPATKDVADASCTWFFPSIDLLGFVEHSAAELFIPMARGVASKIEDAKKHGMLHLSQCHLQRCPSALFAAPELSTSLFRLDLSFNLLENIPDAIGSLANLQVLWLNHNPRLVNLPAALAKCSNLQVLDVNSTAIHVLPCEYGRLQYVKVLDIGGTLLAKRWIKKNRLTPISGDDSDELKGVTTTATRCRELMTQLRRKDECAQLKHALFEKLHDQVYRMERADMASATALRGMLQRMLKHFPLADELRSLIRNAERLFPPPDFTRGATVLENADPVAMRRTYEALRDANDRAKRAADLEIKIRNLYFDRIDPTTVESMVASIYAHIPALQDIKSLIKHAAALFPRDAREVDGQQIQRKLVALQQEIARERSAAVDKLLAAAKALYSDTEPDQVLSLVTKVAALFKNTKELRSLTADVPLVFPAEFLNASPLEIRAVFLRMKADVLGASSTTSANNKTATAKTSLHAAKKHK